MDFFRFWPVPPTIDLSNLPLRSSGQGFPFDEHLLSSRSKPGDRNVPLERSVLS